MTTLMQASRQWASRPADERFVGLLPLEAMLAEQKARSAAKVVSTKALTAMPVPGDEHKGLQIVGQNGTPALTTHWSFGQLASLAGVPAGFLRKLGENHLAPLAADNLNAGLKVMRDVEDVGLLLTREEASVSMRAATGPRYGRIWNLEIVRALIERFGDGLTGDWKVPGEFGKDVPVTKKNTTIWGSDRDIFIFLVDEHNRIEVPNRRGGRTGSMARGFFAWNSEVGSNTVGAAFFLFDYVCANRIVWGAEGYKEFKLRHTVSAPDKWLDQVHPVLIEYANSKASPVEASIVAAQNKKLDDAKDFLAKRFTASQAKLYNAAHEREEGRPIETMWDAVTGMTAYAKSIKFQDERVAVEREAGKLLDLVANK